LVAEALRGRKREDVLLSVKFGAQRDPAGGFVGIDTRPAAVKNSLAQSLVRLDTSYVDIYRPARLDPAVPIEETVGAVADLVKLGYVRYIGLSEVSADTIRRARAVHPVVDLQIEYSLISREIEDEILPACRELGIGITAYGVLSRGLLSGTWANDRPGRDFRAGMPRFQGENLEHNLELVASLRKIADARGVSVTQVAIAWVLSRGDDIVPVVGSRTRAQLSDALAALDVKLGAADLAAIEAAVPRGAAAGERYPEHAMRDLDSERSTARR
jgi:aryl-alcohol dehydrogenase-like predicted oxidoreductase